MKKEMIQEDFEKMVFEMQNEFLEKTKKEIDDLLNTATLSKLKEFNQKLNSALQILKSDERIALEYSGLGCIDLFQKVKNAKGLELEFDTHIPFFTHATIANMDNWNVGIVASVIKNQNKVLVRPIDSETFEAKKGDVICILLPDSNDLLFVKTILDRKDELIYVAKKTNAPYLFDKLKAKECEDCLNIYDQERINDKTHTPPTSAVELAEKLCISEPTVSNPKRPVGQYFKKCCIEQKTKKPRLNYQDLLDLAREAVRRSKQEGSDDLTLNSVKDLKELWK